MKAIFLSIISLVLLNDMIAQPTLNKLYDFNIGHLYSYRKVPANWNIDTSIIQTHGSNITWNFDTITLMPTVFTDSILNPSNQLGNSSFMGATYVWKEYSGVLQYYTKVAYTVFYMGHYSSWPVTFTPNPKTAILPTSYSNGFLYNNFQTTVAGNGIWEYSARYNAFGTLKLPGVTHNNVGLYVTVGGKSNLSFADYLWFKENQNDPVMRIQFVWTPTNSTVQYLYVNTTALQPSSLNEIEKQELVISPNPMMERVSIKSPSTIHSYRIMNSIGQSIRSANPESSSFEINTQDLSQGVYFLILEDKLQNRVTKTIIKNH